VAAGISEACHRFLAKITQAEIASEENTRRIDPRPRHFSSPSRRIRRRSCRPRCSGSFACVRQHSFRAVRRQPPFGRTIHMCGKSAHLHKVLKEDLKMNSSGCSVIWCPKVAAANLGGTTLLWGNLSPMLLKDGTPDQVKQARGSVSKTWPLVAVCCWATARNVCPVRL